MIYDCSSAKPPAVNPCVGHALRLQTHFAWFRTPEPARGCKTFPIRVAAKQWPWLRTIMFSPSRGHTAIVKDPSTDDSTCAQLGSMERAALQSSFTLAKEKIRRNRIELYPRPPYFTRL
jgi:hypothetical protein